jgi:hypothetical protein
MPAFEGHLKLKQLKLWRIIYLQQANVKAKNAVYEKT